MHISYMSLVKTIAEAVTIELDDLASDVELGLETEDVYNEESSLEGVTESLYWFYDKAVTIIGRPVYDRESVVIDAVEYVRYTY